MPSKKREISLERKYYLISLRFVVLLLIFLDNMNY